MCFLVLADPSRSVHSGLFERPRPRPGRTEQVSPTDPVIPEQAVESQNLCSRLQAPLVTDTADFKQELVVENKKPHFKCRFLDDSRCFLIPFSFVGTELVWDENLLVTKLHIIWDTTISVLRASKLGIMMSANGPDPSSSVHSCKHNIETTRLDKCIWSMLRSIALSREHAI